jgi:hypothetical protein
MKNKKHTTELQANYKAMVDSIEKFVIKEGKTLQEAFKAAEEQLEEAKEISKEHIQEASKDLKDKLHLWGDAIKGVNEAYKDQIHLEMTYINDSIWDKLQRVANSNYAELMNFTNTLKEKAQAVRSNEHLHAHQQHNQWACDHALWLDEVEYWKKDHLQARTKLVEIEKQLNQQSKSLDEHSQEIKKHSKIDHQHEKIVANAEQDPTSEVSKIMDEKAIAVHKKECNIHERNAANHQALKSQHLKIMSLVNMLHNEMNKG